MKKVLIVVDYQNDFVCGSLGFDGAAEIDSAICDLVEKAKTDGDDVIFTYDTHDENYLNTNEGRHLPVPHCIRGTEGWQLYGRTAQMVDNKTLGFEKGTFGSWELASYLKAKKYDQVTLIGVVSNICVLSNAILAKAALPEAEIIVDSSATASFDKKLHQSALDVMSNSHIVVK